MENKCVVLCKIIQKPIHFPQQDKLEQIVKSNIEITERRFINKKIEQDAVFWIQKHPHWYKTSYPPHRQYQEHLFP